MFINNVTNLPILQCMAFSPRELYYEVWHNTNLATLHSQVTVGSYWMEYEYKLLRQFTMTVGGTRCCLWLKHSQSNSPQGHTKRFSLYLRIEQSGSAERLLDTQKEWVPSNFENKQQTRKKIFQKFFVWPCSNDIQIDKMQLYDILHAIAWANWRSKFYSNSTEQLPTVTRLCTVVKLVLWQTIAKCLL